ncbi:MAG: NAD(P)/FAD-dependent oxidoreductase [Taibaiella sp.]|nr:NAD(P)/FAD-dependent oxidoreductase [Taibaiella sp.]
MMSYDCVIIGGGISGLSLAVYLAQSGAQVAVIEKKHYPQHKVCGEYISTESLGFLERLGLDLRDLCLPYMSGLKVSSPLGITVKGPLSIGGMGLSRYALDHKLYQLALENGVLLYTDTTARAIDFKEELFTIQLPQDTLSAKTLVGAYGKNSNIDTVLDNQQLASEYIALKYHIRHAGFDPTTVELHSFPGGYCGMSAIEEGLVNMSCICKKSVFKKYNSIPALESKVLAQNPYLKRYFEEAEFVLDKPLTISKLHFRINTPVKDHVLLIGDAAGNIAPLSGNGMSIGLSSALLAGTALLDYLAGKTDRPAMEQKYRQQYYQHFSKRIRVARWVHSLLGKKYLTDAGIALTRLFPFLLKLFSKPIHGKPF